MLPVMAPNHRLPLHSLGIVVGLATCCGAIYGVLHTSWVDPKSPEASPPAQVSAQNEPASQAIAALTADDWDVSRAAERRIAPRTGVHGGLTAFIEALGDEDVAGAVGRASELETDAPAATLRELEQISGQGVSARLPDVQPSDRVNGELRARADALRARIEARGPGSGVPR
jgi:hypothetical protein